MPGSITLVRRAVLCLREDTPYTKETLAASDGIGDIHDLGFVAPEFQPIDITNVVEGTYGNERLEVNTKESNTRFNLTSPVRAAPADGSVPGLSELLYACGLKETINAGASVVYTPQTPADITLDQAASMDLYEGGKLYPLSGVRGNLKLSAKPGDRLLALFELYGPEWPTVTANTDIPAVAAPTEDTVAFGGGLVVTQGGAEIEIGAFDFDLGNVMTKDVSNKRVRWLREQTIPTITIKRLALATEDDWASLHNNAATPLSFVFTFGGGQVVLSAPRARMVQRGPEAQNGRLAGSNTYQLLKSSAGDDAFSLTFTA